jgi:hypothetical protein
MYVIFLTLHVVALCTFVPPYPATAQNTTMRLSTAVALLVVSLSSTPTGAFGTSAPNGLTSARPAFGFSASYRGGASKPLRAASVVDETIGVSTANLGLLSERGQASVQKLVENDHDGSQAHVYAGWPEPGTDDIGKRQLGEQVRVVLELLDRGRLQLCVLLS